MEGIQKFRKLDSFPSYRLNDFIKTEHYYLASVKVLSHVTIKMHQNLSII